MISIYVPQIIEAPASFKEARQLESAPAEEQLAVEESPVEPQQSGADLLYAESDEGASDAAAEVIGSEVGADLVLLAFVMFLALEHFANVGSLSRIIP